jgi:two-component system response regulator CpxR
VTNEKGAEMPIVSIYSGNFCNEKNIVREMAADTGYSLITDENIVSEASKISGISAGKVQRVFSAKPSIFNKFTHEQERSIAHIKLALAQALQDENKIVEGFSSQLVPREVSHVLRVCLIADRSRRVQSAVADLGVSEKEAVKLIRKQDEDRANWSYTLFDIKDPWDASLYDILIPTDKMEMVEIIDLLRSSTEKDVLRTTAQSQKTMEDFLLAARVEVALTKEGHNLEVKAKNGDVTLTINKHVLMLHRLSEELNHIAGAVPGVKTVETKAGPGFHQADIYRKYDFEVPSKVLLVDDEREFVQTLSERLLMRDMGSAVAYDGESALELIQEDEPEVMILDLRMPGIDGIEVLRRVKETNPTIEVIILTGHGSAADKDVCMNLGAFDYLQKPVDIEKLSETIKKANEKIRQARLEG